MIVDLDSKPEELLIHIEQFPKNGIFFCMEKNKDDLKMNFFLFYKIGKLYYKNKETLSNNNKFFYADVLNKFISFKLDDKYADKDKIKLRITDGFFSIFALYEIRRINTVKHLNEIKIN